jgi:Fe-S cluster assembly iron-binding protein IscA
MGMALDEPTAKEQPFQVNGIGILVADDERPFIEGATVDYVKDDYREGFTIVAAGAAC